MSLNTWTDNLKALIEGLDDNIGGVFVEAPKWPDADEMKKDGAIIVVEAPGELDTEEELGLATRFWIIRPWQTGRQLDNATVEKKGSAEILGFFGWRDDHTQAEALREAGDALLDLLMLKETELATLAANMGDGYRGYLSELPQQLSPVLPAQLDGTGAQGHVVRISAGYYEDVAR